MHQLSLQLEPDWHTETDAEIIAAYYRLFESSPDINQDAEDLPAEFDTPDWEAWERELSRQAKAWRCRVCRFWNSADGIEGECLGPELQCGITPAWQGCEQWEPYIQLKEVKL